MLLKLKKFPPEITDFSLKFKSPANRFIGDRHKSVKKTALKWSLNNTNDIDRVSVFDLGLKAQ